MFENTPLFANNMVKQAGELQRQDIRDDTQG